MKKESIAKKAKQKRSMSRVIAAKKAAAWKLGMFHTTYIELASVTINKNGQPYHVDNVSRSIKNSRATREMEKAIDEGFKKLGIKLNSE